ncbi:MAG: CDP-glycerol glycerophosphotransferase family protein [Lachnospiraceae bacterium]|nr:CDP-glycerol glycerophosphotransferase family protein [Lachnospiraceae bacterium]
MLMRVFPIKKNKVTFSAFEGDGGFACNPRYIAEELHKKNPETEIVWLTRKDATHFPDYIKVKEYSDWNIAYHLSTSKVWVDNYRKPFGTIKRKGQFYLQTWHASIGFKAVGLFRGDKFPEIARIVSEADSSLADYFISNSEYCNKVYPKKLLYSGPTLMTGSPRVDCLVNKDEEKIEKVREKLGVKKEEKLLMFAPTFRGGNQKEKKQVVSDIPSVDFDRLIKGLEKQFGGEWKILLRLHPQLSAKLDKMPLNVEDKRLIDVSQAPDISEVLMCCDMLITDYSSCAFDAAFAKIPVLLYADDVQEYIENRGQFMWEKENLPFAIAENNDELEENIKAFDKDVYEKRIAAFMEKHGVIEDGHASERAVDKILEVLK